MTVLTFGTFDKFHPGHQFFLTEAKKHGDRLVVVIARDYNVELVKGHRPSQSETVRQQAVAAFLPVDEVILGLEDYSKKEAIIQRVNPDVICLGYDQAPKFQSPSPAIKVIWLQAFHPEMYKSSLL